MKDNNGQIKKKKSLKRKPIVWVVIIILCIGGIVFGVSKIGVWTKDEKAINDQMEDINSDLVIDEIPADPETDDTVETFTPEVDKNSDYYNYIKLPLISVDFTSLKQKNSDTVAFIKLNGTNINYPVVQTDNNDYYLHHAFDKSTNGAGWVFMDFRNDSLDLDDNTIIYAHGRMSDTMFGSLKTIVKDKWFENTDNYVVNLSTPKENTLWQVFSIYQIPTTNDYITTNFSSEERKSDFVQMLLGRSIYDFETEVTAKDKILTLSTCFNDEEKVVLHAKLIKRQARN